MDTSKETDITPQTKQRDEELVHEFLRRSGRALAPKEFGTDLFITKNASSLSEGQYGSFSYPYIF
ncbi:MAG: hypothetical protein K5770_04790, partial [Lachnospiraceae bacterium]|nr:hypothetical protein [Lachnospiraceae bacterium]